MAWLRRRVSYANVAATAALLLATSGIAVAASSGGAGPIHACARKQGGALRLITPGRLLDR